MKKMVLLGIVDNAILNVAKTQKLLKCQIWGETEGWVPDMSHHSVRICARGSSGSNRRVTWCLIQSLPSSSSERLYRPAVDFRQLELTRF